MDANQQEINKEKLLQTANKRIAFLQQQIANVTKEFDTNIKHWQDEIDLLTLQNVALQSLNLVENQVLETALSDNQQPQ